MVHATSPQQKLASLLSDDRTEDTSDESHLGLDYSADEVFFDTSFGLVYEEDYDEAEDLFSAPLQALEFSSLGPADKVNLDDDLIFMDLSDIITNDNAYNNPLEDHSSLDVLLGSKDAVNSVQDMFSNNEHAYMEMAVLGDNIQGHNMQEMLNGIGITKNTDGSISLGQGWEAHNSGNNYGHYTHSESDTTLFVHQTLIVNGN